MRRSYHLRMLFICCYGTLFESPRSELVNLFRLIPIYEAEHILIFKTDNLASHTCSYVFGLPLFLLYALFRVWNPLSAMLGCRSVLSMLPEILIVSQPRSRALTAWHEIAWPHRSSCVQPDRRMRR